MFSSRQRTSFSHFHSATVRFESTPGIRSSSCRKDFHSATVRFESRYLSVMGLLEEDFHSATVRFEWGSEGEVPDASGFPFRNGSIWIKKKWGGPKNAISIPQRFDLNQNASNKVRVCPRISIPQRFDLNVEAWNEVMSPLISIPQRFDLNPQETSGRLLTGVISIPQRFDLNDESHRIKSTDRNFHSATVRFEWDKWEAQDRSNCISIPQRFDLNSWLHRESIGGEFPFRNGSIWITKKIIEQLEKISIPQRFDLNCTPAGPSAYTPPISIPQRFDLNGEEMKVTRDGFISIPQRFDLNQKCCGMAKWGNFHSATVRFECGKRLTGVTAQEFPFRNGSIWIKVKKWFLSTDISIPQRFDLNSPLD